MDGTIVKISLVAERIKNGSLIYRVILASCHRKLPIFFLSFKCDTAGKLDIGNS